MPKPDYSHQFITKAETAKIQGFNIYALINKYQKISKTAELIPESVYMEVLNHYLTDATGVFQKHTGYYYEIQSVIEDAVHCGAQEALGIHKKLKDEPPP